MKYGLMPIPKDGIKIKLVLSCISYLRILVILFLLASDFLQAQVIDNKFSIEGAVTESVNLNKIYLFDESTGNRLRVLDSADIDHGKFYFKGKLQDRISIMSLGTSDFIKSEAFFVDTSAVSVQVDERLVLGKIVGSRLQNEKKSLDEALSALTAKYQATETELKMAKNLNQKDDLTNGLAGIRKRKEEAIISFIGAQTDGFVKGMLLYSYAREVSRDQINSVASSLNEEQRKTYFISSIATEFHLMENAPKLGDRYLDFTLPDSTGNMIALSKIRSRLTLVEFWASGCGPCRLNNPGLVRIYKKYHLEGFVVIGVSEDRQYYYWQKAIKKDGLPWIQLRDPSLSRNEAVVKYGVFAIPANFLIDKRGMIVGISLSNLDLQKAISENLN